MSATIHDTTVDCVAHNRHRKHVYTIYRENPGLGVHPPTRGLNLLLKLVSTPHPWYECTSVRSNPEKIVKLCGIFVVVSFLHQDRKKVIGGPSRTESNCTFHLAL